MRGSYFDRSIELENIIELPNESGSEFSNQDFEYDQNGLLMQNHPEFQNSDSDEEGFGQNDFFEGRARWMKNRKRSKDDLYRNRKQKRNKYN